LAEALDLAPHPEGGWFRQTWASPETVTLPDGRVRPTATLILFLLPAGEASAWHRVASDEVWLAHAGAVRLGYGGSGAAPVAGDVVLVGTDHEAGESAQARRRLAADAAGGRGRPRELPGLAGLRLRGLRARVTPTRADGRPPCA
jgi:predicted cupin superfamily sugar epimerase